MQRPATHDISREQALAFRVESHCLSARLSPGSLLTAAGACGIQNTPPGSAELALHARVSDLTPGEVEKALLQNKSLLQFWSLRASPYVVPTKDAGVFTTGVLPDSEEAIRHFVYGVEPALDQIGISAVKVVELTATALREELNERALTKDQLGVLLAGRVEAALDAGQLAHWKSPSIYASGQTLGESVVRFFLPILALRGHCCHAERRGEKAYIQRTEQWLGAAPPQMDKEQARLELVKRYLHCYGPSTATHFAAWAGVGRFQADQMWDLVRSDLVEIRYDGQKTWLLESDLPKLLSPSIARGVRLLPPHDPFLSLRDRQTLVRDKALHRLIWLTAGNPGVILSGGKFVGIWRSRKKGRRLAILAELYESLSRVERDEIQAEAEGLAPYKGCTAVEVEFSGD